MTANMVFTIDKLTQIKECQRRFRRGLLSYDEAVKSIGQVLGILPGGFLADITINLVDKHILELIMDATY